MNSIRGVGSLAALAMLLVASAGWAERATAQDDRVTLSVERMLDAAPEDMLRETPGWVAEIDAVVVELESLEASTRKGRGDTTGLPCVMSDLGAARSLQGQAQAAQETMVQSISAGTNQRASFEFRKVFVALEGARTLLANSTSCVEGGGLQVGLTRRQVSSEGGGAGAEMEPLPDDIVDFAFDPFDASPF